ncbi:hypothetical protein TNCV_1799351 [Trichonephila clavipes]|uniref:Uncharacterized protein n=1 Tax=Trichonephila clavipes TaxID=2585209 RepID=A0A8X6ST62_TRICX|nr:hypothetical protein TNCV_1799351 [Trichonephila clavipes]
MSSHNCSDETMSWRAVDKSEAGLSQEALIDGSKVAPKEWYPVIWPQEPSGQGNGLVADLVMSSSPVPLKNCRVEERCTLNL